VELNRAGCLILKLKKEEAAAANDILDELEVPSYDMQPHCVMKCSLALISLRQLLLMTCSTSLANSLISSTLLVLLFKLSAVAKYSRNTLPVSNRGIPRLLSAD
jgi:hypothetical protein